MRLLLVLHMTAVAVVCLCVHGCAPGNGDSTTTAQAAEEGGNQHPAAVINVATTWMKGEHNVSGVITVTTNTLTIAAGSRINMEQSTSFLVKDGGSIKFVGTESEPIVFTSSKRTKAAGDWDSIQISGTAAKTSEISYATIEYGGSVNGSVWLEAGAALKLNNSLVQNSATYGIQADGINTLKELVDNQYINNTGGPIILAANQVDDLQPGKYAPNFVNGIVVNESILSHDATWPNLGTPYRLQGLTLQAAHGSADLTLPAGVTIMLDASKNIVVGQNGALLVSGSTAKPVLFTSSFAEPARADWGAIIIASASIGNTSTLTSAVVEYGGANGEPMVQIQDKGSLALQGTIVRQSGGQGLRQDIGGIYNDKGSNTFTKNAGYPIQVDASVVATLQANQYTGNDRDGIVSDSGIINKANVAWLSRDVPYVLAHAMTIDNTSNTASLSIEPGVTIKLAGGASIIVGTGGRLTLRGTNTSTGKVHLEAENAAEPWGQILYYSSGNTATYTDFSDGGSGTSAALAVTDNGFLSLSQVTFHTQQSTCLVTGPTSITASQAGANCDL